MLTREEALDLISDVEKFYCESADEYGYYCYEAESVINKIYDSFEEAMKPKRCSSCKYWDFNEQGHFKRCFNGKGNVVSTEADFGCNRYEPKE